MRNLEHRFLHLFPVLVSVVEAKPFSQLSNILWQDPVRAVSLPFACVSLFQRGWKPSLSPSYLWPLTLNRADLLYPHAQLSGISSQQSPSERPLQLLQSHGLSLVDPGHHGWMALTLALQQQVEIGHLSLTASAH